MEQSQAKAPTRNYRDLIVWQQAIQLAKAVYVMLQKFPKQEMYALSDQIRRAAIDSLVACKFSFFGATLEEYAELLAAATGCDVTPQGLKEIGERICLTERFYNCANGFTMEDDLLPERFYTEPGSSGEGIEIPPLDRERFMEELRKYYRIRGLTDEGTFADAGFLARLP